MNREIVIISVARTQMTIIEPSKEPNVVKFHNFFTATRNEINRPLQAELTRFYNEGYTIQTSNVLSFITTYILVK